MLLTELTTEHLCKRGDHLCKTDLMLLPFFLDKIKRQHLQIDLHLVFYGDVFFHYRVRRITLLALQ